MSHRVTCALSQLPVDTDVYWLLLVQPYYTNAWAHQYWTPRHLPITGRYDGYGQIDNVEEGALFDVIERGLKFDRNGTLLDWWEQLYADTLSVKNNVPRLTTPEGLPEATARTFKVRQTFIRKDVWELWCSTPLDGIEPVSNYREDVRFAFAWLEERNGNPTPLGFQLWNATVRKQWPLASALLLELDSQALGSMKIASHLVLLCQMGELNEPTVQRAAEFCRICDIMQQLGRFWHPSEQVSDDVPWTLHRQVAKATEQLLSVREKAQEES